jgi:hypothetical protein
MPTTCHRGSCANILLLAASTFLLTQATEAAEPRVEITGGADPAGQQYAWTVTNRSASPVVEVHFPHHRATLFFAPHGWPTSCVGLAGSGSEKEPGLCTARAPSPGEGIAEGRSLTFQMRVAPSGVRRAAGEATIVFADGSEAVMEGVEVAAREPAGDKYTPLIGLGVLFVILLVANARRRRKPPPAKT